MNISGSRKSVPRGFTLSNLLLWLGAGVIFALPLALLILPSQLAQANTLQTDYEINNNALWILLGIAYYIRPPILCVAVLSGLYLILRRNRHGLMLNLWLLLPIATISALTFVSYTANRYALIALPACLVLVAVGIRELNVHLKPGLPRLLLAGLPLLLFADSLGEDMLYMRYNNGNRPDWRGAFTFIKAHRDPDDLVVTTKPPLATYYLHEEMPSAAQFSDLTQADPNYFYSGASDFAVIDLFARGDPPTARVWIIEDLNAVASYGPLLPWVYENCHQLASFDNVVAGRDFRMRVWLYDPHQPPPLR